MSLMKVLLDERTKIFDFQCLYVSPSEKQNGVLFLNNHYITFMRVENYIHLNDMMYKSYRKCLYGRGKALKIPMQFVWCGKIEIFRMWHLICVLIFSVIRGYVNANWKYHSMSSNQNFMYQYLRVRNHISHLAIPVFLS